MRRRLYFLIPLCVLWMTGPRAEEPRTLAWEELSVRLSASENPFMALSNEQLLALSDVAGVRTHKASGATLTPEEISIEKKALTKLKQDGIDADRLLAMRDAIAEKKRAAASAVNPTIDGKLIRLAGYVLPLEFSGTKVSEFLLVPWVGACIHTPPPEPNQIVYVKPEKAFDIRRMFDAVWVTGRISASGSRRLVEIVDGSADVDVGYSLRASLVEPYQQ
jgi:uncharacterized protein